MLYLCVGLAVAVLALLVAHAWGSRVCIWLSKPIASTLFMLMAWRAGAPDSAFGLAMLVGLGLFWVSDVLLIPDSRTAFVGGLVAALLGHLAYIAAFALRGLDGTALLGAAALTLVPLVLVRRWLRPHLPERLRLAVQLYMLTFAAMLACAASTTAAHGNGLIALGAFLFFISDLAVARHRFVAKSFTNKLWGLPLYYTAQAMLAIATG